MVQWLGICTFTAEVHSLNGELRSHKPHRVARKKRKRVNFMYVNYIPIKLLQKYYSDNGSICFIRIPKASEIHKGLLTLSLYLETYSSQLLPRNLFLGIFPKHCSNISSIKQASSTSPGRSLLLLLLSRFSRVRLCATPETAAHQAPPSLGFPRQEHWSGLPFPSPMHESEK